MLARQLRSNNGRRRIQKNERANARCQTEGTKDFSLLLLSLAILSLTVEKITRTKRVEKEIYRQVSKFSLLQTTKFDHRFFIYELFFRIFEKFEVFIRVFSRAMARVMRRKRKNVLR